METPHKGKTNLGTIVTYSKYPLVKDKFRNTERNERPQTLIQVEVVPDYANVKQSKNDIKQISTLQSH